MALQRGRPQNHANGNTTATTTPAVSPTSTTVTANPAFVTVMPRQVSPGRLGNRRAAHLVLATKTASVSARPGARAGRPRGRLPTR